MTAGIAMFRRLAWGRRVALALMPLWCGLFLAYLTWFALAQLAPALSRAAPVSAAAVVVLIAIPLFALALYVVVPALVFLELRHEEAAAWFREGPARV